MYNLYTQYSSATRFNKLVSSLAEVYTLDPSKYLKDYYNILSANSDGLDFWGVVLNIPRTMNYYELEDFFGFYRGKDEETRFQENFNNGIFFNKDSLTNVITLSDEAYRRLLYFKNGEYQSNLSILSLIRIINIYTQSINSEYRCNVINMGSNLIKYDFNYTLSDMEISLFKLSKILPAPAGVEYLVEWK